jgi:carboxypeptidase Taq
LQDIHWSAFAIGYFPTYLLGSSTAAQLAFYCEKDIPDMYEKIERGQFQEMKEWLTSKIHIHGKRYKSLDDLLEEQLGEKLNPKYFTDYLESKYSKLYSC